MDELRRFYLGWTDCDGDQEDLRIDYTQFFKKYCDLDSYLLGYLIRDIMEGSL